MRILFTYCQFCSYHTGFDYYSNNTVSVLSVGNLIATGATLDAYVIDWYLNDVVTGFQFTTGKGTDPDITYSHPFTGTTGSIPVEDGVWIPVIRYIVVDGIKIYSKHRPWEDYCEIPTISVQPYLCDNGNSGTTYSHTLSFVNTLQQSQYSSRSIRFYLNDDASTKYFGVSFYGYDIADRLRVYYCTSLDSTGVLLEDIAIGIDTVTSYYLSEPRRFRPLSPVNPYRFVVNLTGFTYTLGDYLKFDISPSYMSPSNLNTNWRIDLKCLSAADGEFTCLAPTAAMQTINPDTVAMTWYSGATNCRYDITFKLNDIIPVYVNTDAWKYMNINLMAESSNIVSTMTDDNGGIRLTKYSGANATYVTTVVGTCINLNGAVTLTKTSNQMVISCTNNTDYLKYKTDYNTTTGTTKWQSQVNDPTNINYYMWWQLSFRVATSCGDAYTDNTYRINKYSTFTFDDINNTITIDLVDANTGDVAYVSGDCDNTTSTLITSWTTIHSTYTLANFTKTTNVKYYSTGALAGVYANQFTTNVTNTTGGLYLYLDAAVHDSINTNLCDFTAPWCLVSGNAPQYRFYKYNVRGVISPTNAVDPTQNFELYNRLNSSGCTITPAINEILIYKILNGVRILDWVAGTYNTGDRVINVGKAWESLVDSNVTEPTVTNAYWTKISTY